jgi:hypothetical protein
MNKQRLDEFKAWFADYTSRFYADDAFVNANLKLKQEHTFRVCREINYLTDELDLGESERLLAETIALFHDVGRYSQFAKYHTFSDAKSVPHGPLAVEVLQKHNVLDGIDSRHRTIIEQAIKLHAVMEVPQDTDADIATFAQLIRDADKLDIYHLVAVVAEEPRDKSEEDLMINWFDRGQGHSDAVVRAVLAREPISYNIVKTYDDMRIMQLAWVYDLNFRPTFAKLKHEGYLEKMIESLPDTPEIRQIARQVTGYVKQRLNGECEGGAI